MLRLAETLAAVLVATLVVAATARGQEDMRTASKFLDGLRERGYYELAAEYLERLRTLPDTPAELRDTIDYEQGRIMIDEASKTGDLVLRKELLDKARGKLVAFTEAHPKDPLAPEAYVQLARLLVERGHLAMLRGEETDKPKEKAALVAEARSSFDDARAAYNQADEKLTAAFKTFPTFIPDNETRRKEERDRTHTAMMDAQLQKAVVDYEQGQTYPAGSKERADYLAKGLAQFEDLYKRYRTQFAGLTARMWQAKCFEEKGDYGPAMGIYNELMEHSDPRLRGLQRQVGYFQTILYNKRKEYPLAELGAQGWLRAYSTPAELNTPSGVGVRFEMAKALLAQAAEVPSASEKAAKKARAVEMLRQVVRYTSPQKAEALKLLKEHKPSAAARFEEVARLNFEDAMTQADEAIASHEWDKAILLLKQAIRRADPAKDPDKAILPRYNLAFCYYMDKRYYEAAVVAEHLARRYPNKPLAPKAVEIGMAALADAYNSYRDVDRTSDLNTLIGLAEYAIATWPDKDEGDLARMTLGQIYQGLGKYPKAIEVYESVRTKSPKWVDAQTSVGASHWEQSRALRRAGKESEADAEVAKALGTLGAALKARQEAGTAATDSGLIGNVCDIADIQLETGKPAEALAVLNPIAKAQHGTPGPAYNRLMAALLRAHINSGQVQQAQADMAALEKAGGGSTQLYFGLGKLLQKEMDTLRSKGDSAKLARVQADYQKFLSALINAKTGQTYESLQWAGENMLTLGNPKEAGAVFLRILETAAKEPSFLGQSANERLLRTKLKQAAALRGLRDFAGAEDLIKKLRAENPRALDPMIEQGLLLEDKAAAGQAKWSASIAFWQNLAPRLGRGRTKPPEYYDAWYHVAYAMYKDNQPAKAKQILGGVMRLSPGVGGEEMKKKYTTLLATLK